MEQGLWVLEFLKNSSKATSAEKNGTAQTQA